MIIAVRESSVYSHQIFNLIIEDATVVAHINVFRLVKFYLQFLVVTVLMAALGIEQHIFTLEERTRSQRRALVAIQLFFIYFFFLFIFFKYH